MNNEEVLKTRPLFFILCSSQQIGNDLLLVIARNDIGVTKQSLVSRVPDSLFHFLFVLLACPKRTKRISQSDPSARVMILSFLTHIPEYPHKIIPAPSCPAYFDWPTHALPDGKFGDSTVD